MIEEKEEEEIEIEREVEIEKEKKRDRKERRRERERTSSFHKILKSLCSIFSKIFHLSRCCLYSYPLSIYCSLSLSIYIDT